MTSSPYQVPPALPVRPGRRPGLITAIGVISIIVASISLIAAAVDGLYVFVVQHVGQLAANKAQSITYGAGANGQQPSTMPAIEGVPTPEELEQELARQDAELGNRRDAIVELLGNLQELTPRQRDHLAAGIGRFGERIVPASLFKSSALSPAELRDWVRQSGAIPAQGSVFFRLKTGQLEVFEDGCVFRPGDGGNNLRTSTREGQSVAGLQLLLGNQGPASRPADGSTLYKSGLTGSQVEQALSAIQSHYSGTIRSPLNPAQQSTLRNELRTRVPPLVTRNTAYQPIRRAEVDQTGKVRMQLSNGYIEIDAAGQVLEHSSNAIDQITLSPLAGVLKFGELFASLLLAGFLMTAGILTLRESRLGGGMHWIYAWIKLPLAIIAGVATAWMQMELSNGFGRLSGSGSESGWSTFGIVVTGLVALYPLVLMCVLSTRTVREFYARA